VAEHPGSVAVSAITGEGIDDLLQALGDRLRSLAVVYELIVPYERGDVLASIHREGEVVSTTDGESAWTIRARLSEASAGRLGDFILAETAS
jgi:GTP-binding protein HflX